jgi:hypothetical protein
MLREMFPNGRFSPPASEGQIARAEALLGIRLPEQLRTLYRECDGFQEHHGGSNYLLPLEAEGQSGSLVANTLFWWREWKTIQEDAIDFSPFIFFGMSGGDVNWAIRLGPPHEIIAYHHHMGYDCERLGESIVAVYRRDQSEFEVLDKA